MNLRLEKASKELRAGAAALLAVIVVLAATVNFVPAVEKIVLKSSPATCTMKKVAGIPCLACRGTRAGFAFAHGRIGEAFHFNPLLALVAVGATVWGAMVAFAGWTVIPRIQGTGKVLFWICLVFALAGNWLYVIKAGG